MHPAIWLITKAMHADLGWAVADQIERVARNGELVDINPVAMRRAMAWIAERSLDLEQILAEDAWEAVEDLAVLIEQELEEAGR